MANSCFICDIELNAESECVIVKQKGVTTLINSSKARQDNKWKFLVGLESVKVHIVCRKNYKRPQTIKKCVYDRNEPGTTSSPGKGQLHSTYSSKFKENCLFCDHPCSKELEMKSNKDPVVILSLMSLHFISNNQFWTWRIKEVTIGLKKYLGRQIVLFVKFLKRQSTVRHVNENFAINFHLSKIEKGDDRMTNG